MSADNWRICPRCKARREREREVEILKAGRAYGKVPAEEYIAMARQASQIVELDTTLREDYEQGTRENGVYFVSYHCSCSECGFEYVYKHEEKLNLD